LIKIRTILAAELLILSIIFPLGVYGQSSESARDMYDTALNLYHAQKNDESLNELSRAVKIYPNFADAYTLTGIVLNTQEKYNESLAPFKKAIDIYENGNPSFASQYNLAFEDKGDPYTWSGFSLANLGRYNESIDMYRKGITSYEDYARALDMNPEPVGCHEGGCEIIDPDGSLGPRDNHFRELVNERKSDNQRSLFEATYAIVYPLYLTGRSDEALQYVNKAESINQTLTVAK
jgi:tetratricopeptide (TPR) repeat protein